MNARPALPWLFALFLAGCGGGPPPADWKLNAVSLLDHAQQRWLEGDTPAAELALGQVRQEIAKSGRTDLLARAELAACAARVASLDFAPCTAYDKLAPDAAPADRAYARFLAGDWQDLDGKWLAVHYAGLVGAKEIPAANQTARDIKDPLPRLLAIALLFKAGRSDPASLAMAVDTASERGWRRPLLAWLEVGRQRALAAGDTAAAEHFQRRRAFVLQSTKTP
ncbi:MAG: hypothetical protein AB1899_12380 [Pseudomonadota bacterium]